MELRILGRTGIPVSVLGIGTWQLSGPLAIDGKADGFPDPGRDAAIDLIRACGDLGLNLIDTAEIYGDGEGEQRVGVAVHPDRDRWVIVTKFGLRRGGRGERIVDARPETIRPSLEGSLRRLRTDYVDVFLYHTGPKRDDVARGLEVLHRLRDERRIRAFGISTDDPVTARLLVREGGAEVLQFTRSLVAHPGPLLDLAASHDLGVIVRGALAGGRLAGARDQSRPVFPENDIRSHLFDGTDSRLYRAYEHLRPPGSSTTAFALRYLLDSPATHAILLGGRSNAQYEEALGALRMPPLGDSTHRAIRKIRTRFTAPPLRRRALRSLRRTAGWLVSIARHRGSAK